MAFGARHGCAEHRGRWRHPDQGCRRCRVRASSKEGPRRSPDRGQDGIPLLGITGDHRFDRRAGNAIIEIGRRGPCDGLAILLICHLPGVDKRGTRRSSRLLRKAEPQAQDRPADLGVDAVGPSPRRSPQRVDENNLEAPVMKTLVNLAVIAACRPLPGSPRGREATCPWRRSQNNAPDVQTG